MCDPVSGNPVVLWSKVAFSQVRGAVALLAGLREVRLHVVRIRRALEILQVAAHAGRIRAGQVVVVIHVALRRTARAVRVRPVSGNPVVE